MSYRTVKRLLGETSLERKCRYLFGGGLTLLISASFYVYAQMTSGLVYDQDPKQAQRLIYPIILEKHIKKLESSDTLPAMNRIISDLRGSEQPPTVRFFKPLRRDVANTEAELRPSEPEDYEAIDAFEKGAKDYHRYSDKDH